MYALSAYCASARRPIDQLNKICGCTADLKEKVLNAKFYNTCRIAPSKLPRLREFARGHGNAGFSRFITSDDGQTYHLPTAEYDRSGDLTRSQVLSQARAAANSTGRDNAVLVTESKGRTWNGLQKVEGGRY